MKRKEKEKEKVGRNLNERNNKSMAVFWLI
jgi:hypothetical protein